MPLKFEKFPPNWDDIDDECQHIPLNCPWTITSENEFFYSHHHMLELDFQL